MRYLNTEVDRAVVKQTLVTTSEKNGKELNKPVSSRRISASFLMRHIKAI